MNAAIAIASRELRDRSRLFLIAAVMAVVPFVAALTLRDQRQSGIALVAGFLAVSYSAGLALILGISTIGRELSEKRAAFLFSTPVSPAAMWFGKTTAALLICFGAFSIIMLPTFLLAREGWIDTWSDRGALYAIVSCTALFLGGHVASTMLRSRSARIAIDVVFLALTLLAVVALFRPLLLVGAGDVALKLAIAMGSALLATLVLAPVWQLARGRIDPQRNHAALDARDDSVTAPFAKPSYRQPLRAAPSPTWSDGLSARRNLRGRRHGRRIERGPKLVLWDARTGTKRAL